MNPLGVLIPLRRPDLGSRKSDETGQPGLEPGIAGFGDRCLSQLGHCPRGLIVLAARRSRPPGGKCGRRDSNPHGPKPTRT